jgi:hypothetical protein
LRCPATASLSRTGESDSANALIFVRIGVGTVGSESRSSSRSIESFPSGLSSRSFSANACASVLRALVSENDSIRDSSAAFLSASGFTAAVTAFSISAATSFSSMSFPFGLSSPNIFGSTAISLNT